jgi:hypothetical protein
VLLPQNAFFSIDDATVAPLGNGLMLTVNFNARKGRTTANGRLYIVGVPVYDAAKAELRVEELEFSVETKNILLKAADWLAHDSLLAELQQAVVFQLQDDLARATAKANAELEELKGKPPNGIGAVVKVTDLSVERLAFAKDRGFAIVTAKGKMSARLQP